ncbi:MAG: hypothetical protein WC718_07225, partial [Phycisphaerales bacterium]
MAVTTQVAVDWDADDSYATAGDDISAYVFSVAAGRGLYDPINFRTADPGSCTLLVRNDDKRFSINNSSGAYYGKLLPGRKVRIQTTDGVSTWDAWYGTISKIKASQEAAPFLVEIQCEGVLGRLARHRLALPLQEDQSSDALIRKICAAAFGGVAASGTVTFAAQPANNDAVTIGARTYTFKTTLTGAAYEVKIGTSTDDTLSNLIACINADIDAGTAYGTNTVRHELVTASGAGGASDVQEQHNFNEYFKTIGNLGGADYWAAQQIVPGVTGNITEIDIFLYGGNGTGTITIELWSDDGSDAPDSMLKSMEYTPATDPDPAVGINTILPTSAWGVTSGTKYFIIQYPTDAQAANHYWLWGGSSVDAYPPGVTLYSTNAGASWSVSSTEAWFTVVTSPQPAILANARGTWGNAIGLSKSGANITVSAATLEGGTDGTVTLDLDASVLSYPTAGDQWSEEQTTGLTAIQDVIDSGGTSLFWEANNGDLKYRDKGWWFALPGVASSLTVSDTMAIIESGADIDYVHNDITLTYTPKTTKASGVIAKSNDVITVPVTTYSARWNSTLDMPADGKYLLRLSFVDQDTGEVSGATDVITPLAGTDFDIWESIGGRGYT